MAKKQLTDATPADVVKRLMKDGKLKRKCCRSKPRCRKCPVLALQRAKDASRVTEYGPLLFAAATPVKGKGKGDRVLLSVDGKKPNKKAAKKIAKRLKKGGRLELARPGKRAA